MDKDHHQITLAYFNQRSTVDYIGVVQGLPVCFDAKECVTDTFPLHNIHAHQIQFMRDFETQQGLAFLIIYFSSRNRIYYMRCREMLRFWERGQQGGRKSIRIEELSPEFFFELQSGIFIPYLEGINLDLDTRENLDKDE